MRKSCRRLEANRFLATTRRTSADRPLTLVSIFYDDELGMKVNWGQLKWERRRRRRGGEHTHWDRLKWKCSHPSAHTHTLHAHCQQDRHTHTHTDTHTCRVAWNQFVQLMIKTSFVFGPGDMEGHLGGEFRISFFKVQEKSTLLLLFVAPLTIRGQLLGLCVCVCVCLIKAVGRSGEPSVGFVIGGEQGGVHGLHAGGAGEGSHQPVVYTVHVVDVHTRQESDGVPINKIQHADHASKKKDEIQSLNSHQD